MKLKDYLRLKNLTLKDFGDLLGVNATMVSLYCNKKVHISRRMAIKILNVTNGMVSLQDQDPEIYQIEKMCQEKMTSDDKVLFEYFK